MDRMDVRRAVGAAVARISAARKAHFEDPARQAERSRLHKAWRDLLDQAAAAQKAYDRFVKSDLNLGVSESDLALIAKAKRDHPDMQVWRDDPDGTPICCSATGLAMFEGDAVFGDPQYGGGVLKLAVTLTVPSIEENRTARKRLK